MDHSSSPLKIAHVMAGAAHGGAELFYERLCIAQHQQGLSILPIIRNNEERKKKLEAARLSPIMLPFGGFLDWRTHKEMRQSLEKFAPNVAIAWMNRAASFMPKGDWVSVGRLGGFYDLKYYKNCDHLVGNTHGIVQWLIEQGWPKDRAHYVPNFAREFPQVTPKKPDFIPKDNPFVLALGRLHPNKGFDVLIKAMSHVKNAHLLIAGEGPERENLEKLARILNLTERVHMPGWIEDISSVLAASDILICSSRHEPLGNVVLEGFAAKRPVVAMASQGPIELIANREDGLLTPMEDVSAMAEAINKVLDDKDFADKIRFAGRKKFENEYCKDIVLNKWLDFLSQVRKI